MRMSQHFPTTRRSTREGLIDSQRLLEQAGYFRNVASGVHALLPLGWRVLQRVRQIVFEEMERAGIQNLQLPILQPRELWQQTERWDKYVASKTMFTTTEQHSGAVFGLSPTAEEVVTMLVAGEVHSYRDLPVILHQIGPKFRDEIRPRFGLLRAREFEMSDAYSFDINEEGMRHSFELLRLVYERIFTRAGLTNCLSVHADSGAIGGQGSAESMAVCAAGEDVLLTCDHCDYGANAEKAESRYPHPEYTTELQPVQWEVTPNIMTVEQLEAHFPGIAATDMIKTIIFTVDPDSGSPYEVAVCIRGDLEINETKLRNALKADALAPSDASVVREVTGAEVGFAGPIGLGNVARHLFDESVKGMTNFLCGYNTTDHHALNVNFGRDIPEPESYVSVHAARQGDQCAACEHGTLRESRGIEVGHIFMLQQGYAHSLNATFTDETGAEQVIWMGCYGIGTTRLMQAIVEQNNDKDGIMWPESVAPYHAYVMTARASDECQKAFADQLVSDLMAVGVEVLYDDRTISAGEKFMDADLIGCPWRITVGRKAAEGLAECRNRRTKETTEEAIHAIVHKFATRSQC